MRVSVLFASGLLAAVGGLSPVSAQDWELAGSRPIAASRPTVDPGIVGSWKGKGKYAGLFRFHSLGEIEYEIWSVGIARVHEYDQRYVDRFYLLEASDRHWTLEAPDGTRRHGRYAVVADDQITWLEGDRRFVRMDRVDGPKRIAAPDSRPGFRPNDDATEASRLIALASDPTPGYRELGLFHLARLAAKTPENAQAAIPVLATALGDSTAGIQQLAATALAALGSSASAAVPALVGLTRSPNADLRIRSANALGRIAADPDLTIPALRAMLGDQDEHVRVAAVEALGKFGNRAAGVVVTALADRSLSVNEAAVESLKAMGHQARAALPGLILILREGPTLMRFEAAKLIAAVGPSGGAGATPLIQALEDSSPDVAEAAADALRAFPDDAATSVPAIVRLLDRWSGSKWLRRKRLIDTLAAFGPSAAVAIPTLTKVSDDFAEPSYLRYAAEEARDRISKK